MTTYTVYHCSQGSATADTGLTEAEVVRRIWTDDGKGFRLELRMETPQDDEGNDLEERQVENATLGLEWDVYFTKAGQKYGEKSQLTAYGVDEDAAENDLLMDAWKRTGWDDRNWIIVTDEQHAADLVRVAAECAQEDEE